jgi:hypothetical protein
MTPQQIFDTVVNHLRQQKCQSLSSTGHCAYRGKNGTKCAAGCIIADEEYVSAMENIAIFALLGGSYDFVPQSLIERMGDNKNLLWDLQSIHDNFIPEFWEDQFSRIALHHKLIYSESEQR